MIVSEVNRNLLKKKMISTMLEAEKENGLRHAGIRERKWPATCRNQRKKMVCTIPELRKPDTGRPWKLCDRNVVMKRRCCKKVL